MSLSLTLLPIEVVNNHWYSHSVLHLEQDQALFDAISKAERLFGDPVREGFNSHMSQTESREGRYYGETTQTAYGDPIKCVRVAQLRLLGDLYCTDKNRAVLAYLRCLDYEIKVALYWH